jgi:hypothetical protein
VISLSSIRKARGATSPLALFYGVAGVGKTALAAEAPSPIFIRTGGENFPAELAGKVDEFPETNDFASFVAAIGSLLNEDHDFKTLVIDSLSGVEFLIWAEACRRGGWQTIEDPGFGKGYVAASSLWKDILDGLRALRAEKGMAIVLIGHTEIGRFDSPTTDPYSRYRVGLHKRAADEVEEACDLIAFINYRTTLKKADVGFNKTVTHAEGGGARVIYTEERPGFIAKSRYGMPSEIAYKKGEGWAALAKYFPTAA